MQNKPIKRKKWTGGILAAVFLSVYIPSFLYWIYGGNISTELLRMGTIEDSVNVVGYIIRDSQVYKSPFDGKFIKEAEEGERIPAGSRVATVIKHSSVKLLELLEEKNRKILEARNEKEENLELFSGDIKKLEGEIEKKIRLIVDGSNTNAFGRVGEIKKEISRLVEKKVEIIGGSDTGDAYIKSLVKEMESLKEQIRANTVEIATEKPGVVSYFVDAYEEALNSRAIPELTPGALERIDAKTENAEQSGDLTVDRPFAKVVTGSEYHIAFILSDEEAKKIEAGKDRICLRLNSIGAEADCSVVSKSKHDGNRYVVVVRIDRYMNETVNMRKINVDLVFNRHSGLKVPLKSLMNIDLQEGKADIFLVKANCASRRRVSMKGWDNESAILYSEADGMKNSVSLYDTYVVNPNNIEEGQIIIK